MVAWLRTRCAAGPGRFGVGFLRGGGVLGVEAKAYGDWSSTRLVRGQTQRSHPHVSHSARQAGVWSRACLSANRRGSLGRAVLAL